MKTRKRISNGQNDFKNMVFEFFVATICHFEKNILQKIYSVTNSLLTRKDSIKKNSPKIAYNMKGCLKLFLLSYFEYRPNLAKYTCYQRLPFEQHDKIGKKNTVINKR
jgi:hypothetical protein